MSRWNEGRVVSDGQERLRKNKEREVRDELLRTNRRQLDESGPLEGAVLKIKILLAARKAAADASRGNLYLEA